jgi:hypothetical protein
MFWGIRPPTEAALSWIRATIPVDLVGGFFHQFGCRLNRIDFATSHRSGAMTDLCPHFRRPLAQYQSGVPQFDKADHD